MEPFTPQALPLTGIPWERLVPRLGRANRSIAYYSGVLHGVPNPDVLLSPLTTQEAVLSSRIEGTQATLGEVLKFEAGEEPQQASRREDIHEILNYRRALRAAETELRHRPFSLNLLLKLHSILLDGARGANKARGRIRTAQNWIGAPNTPIEQAEFVPPAPGGLQAHLDAWEKYYHREEPDSLVQLAVVHAQFEIIHPFLDGNGRLGRILIPLFLFERQLLHRPMFYLSSWIEENRDEYINLLRNLGRPGEAWAGWIAFFLRGVDEQALQNARKAQAIIALYERLKERVIDLTHSQYAVPLLDQIFKRPIFRTSHINLGVRKPSRPALANLLRVLREEKILKVIREGAGRRPTTYAFAELINLCEGKQVI
jgi:Fic family protein